MTMFEQAARLNNKGVGTLLNGDTTQAVQFMTQSIQMLKQEIRILQQEEVPADGTAAVTPSSHGCDTGHGSSSTNMSAAATTTMPAMAVRIPTLAQLGTIDGTVLFNQAVIFPIGIESSHVEKTEISLHFHSACVIFNLAIAYQTQMYLLPPTAPEAYSPGCFADYYYSNSASLSARRTAMAKAEKLYFMVLQLLDDQACNEMQRTAKILKLASLNNLSQIHYLSGDYDKASDCITCLRLFLHQNASESFLNEPELRHLLMNTFLLRVPDAAPAA